MPITQVQPEVIPSVPQKFLPPKLIWTNPQSPRNSKAAAIFYSPHQDDETLAMCASIAEHVRHGRPVIVVLYSSGEICGALEILNGMNSSGETVTCDYHNTIHQFHLSPKEFVKARNAEFLAACKQLGVQQVYIANNGKGYDENLDQKAMICTYRELMLYFDEQFPGCSHKLISGDCDHTLTGVKHPTHRAGAIAANQLFHSGKIRDIRLYRDYVYYFPEDEREAQWKKKISASDKQKRRRAMDEYNLFNPKIGRYAIGCQHSVYELFDASYESDYEYIDYPKRY